MTAAAPSAAEAAHAEALAALFARLAGHVSTLCAASCVSRAWRDAAAAPRLWKRLHRLRSTYASRLTDDLLLSLVYRSQSTLERIDLTCCFRITDAGLAAALQYAPALEFLAVMRCPNLTAAGVARALRGRRLQELHVRGISAGVGDSTPLNTWCRGAEDDEMDDERWKSYDAFNEPDDGRCLERLHDCVRYEGALDAVAVCGGTRFSACVGGTTSAADDRSDDWEARCALLCSSGDLTCCDCDEYRCAFCAAALAYETAPAPPGRRCSTCHNMVCSVCLEDVTPGSAFYRQRRGRSCEVCACCTKVRCADCVDRYNKPWERSVLCGGGCNRTLCGFCVTTANRVATCAAAEMVGSTMGQLPRHVSRDCFGVLCNHCVGGRNSRECVRCGRTACAGCLRNLPNIMAGIRVLPEERQTPRSSTATLCALCWEKPYYRGCC